jgi:hypothetical protein
MLLVLKIANNERTHHNFVLHALTGDGAAGFRWLVSENRLFLKSCLKQALGLHKRK